MAVPVAIGALTAGMILAIASFANFPPRSNIEDRTNCTYWGLAANDARSTPADLPEESDPANGVYLDETFSTEMVSSQYHLFADGIDFSRPVGLVVRLHGDGAYEFEHPEGLVRCLAAVASSHNMALLAPVAPAYEQRWWLEMSETQPWLMSLVDGTIAEHGLDPDNVWWMGYSGGAEFLTYSLALTEPERISGGAIMVGGGGAPETSFTPSHSDPDTPMLWTVGTADDGSTDLAPFDALTASQEGAAFYEDADFGDVDLELFDGVDHFLMPQAAILDTALEDTALEDAASE